MKRHLVAPCIFPPGHPPHQNLYGLHTPPISKTSRRRIKLFPTLHPKSSKPSSAEQDEAIYVCYTLPSEEGAPYLRIYRRISPPNQLAEKLRTQMRILPTPKERLPAKNITELRASCAHLTTPKEKRAHRNWI